MSRHHRVGLVLGAGGPVGFAFHAGVLSALTEAGWDARDARVVLGTSIGAATGALLRAGMKPEDLRHRPGPGDPSELGVMGYDVFSPSHRGEVARRARAAMAARLEGAVADVGPVRSALGLGVAPRMPAGSRLGVDR